MIGKLALALFGSCALLQADEAPISRLQQGITLFDQAYKHWDSAEFWNSSCQFRKSIKEHPQSADAHYLLGLTHFHRMLQLQSRPPTPKLNQAAQGDLNHALEALEKSLELDPKNPEAHAIVATLYGMKINGSLMRAVRYGPKVQNHQKLALQHGAKNPRVHYLIGAGLLHTAKDDADHLEALKSFLLAEALYKAEQTKPHDLDMVDWGYDACLTFIGQTFAQLHKPAKARDYYQKALVARPNNPKAKAGLAKLPH